MRHLTLIISLATVLLGTACTNDIKEVENIATDSVSANMEVGKNIMILYSDSAVVSVRIHAPVMERITTVGDEKDIFPKGILVEFLNSKHEVYSWLKADVATREQRTQRITATGHVEFFNEKNEKLETPELIWDERTREAYSDKIVRITQAEKGDTTIGFGFKATQNFKRFEIVKKVHGKFNVHDFVNQNP